MTSLENNMAAENARDSVLSKYYAVLDETTSTRSIRVSLTRLEKSTIGSSSVSG